MVSPRLVRIWWRGVRTWSRVWAYGTLAAWAGIAHLAEVHLADAGAGALARRATGWASDLIGQVEEPLTLRIAEWHSPALVAGVAAYYLGMFLLLLGSAPALVAADGDERLLKRTLLSYPVLYLVALPFFLFFPSVNPYSRLAAQSPFDGIHPHLEDAYYALTTRDNTFPSLHVAFTVVLVANVLRTRWRFVRASLLVHGVLLVASVVFLRVHFVTDVVGGLLAAWLGLRIVDACLAPAGRLSGVGRALDRACALWQPQRSWAYRTVQRWVEGAPPAE